MTPDSFLGIGFILGMAVGTAPHWWPTLASRIQRLTDRLRARHRANRGMTRIYEIASEPHQPIASD